MAIALRNPVGLRTGSVAPARSRAAVRVICQAQREEHATKKFALPVATLVATAMISGAMLMPEEALAAKSSGRVGGSSGFKSRRMEASSPSVRSRSTVVNNTVVVAPPVVAPPLFGGFGYGFGMPFGVGFGMPIFPFPFFGGLLQFFFVITLLSVVFSVIRGLLGSGNKNNKKDDGWGDL